MKDYAVNRSRSFIFSTALPPLCAEWTLFVVDRMVDMDDRRAHLAALASALCDQLAGFGDEPLRPSHIMPLVIGDPHRVVKLSAKLLDRGFKVLPIRTPTVPPSTERLRFSLSAALSLDDIACLGDQLREVME
jgi:8-amino-7-oxononanoate synthase